MENAPYSTLERVALDVASQALRPELFARITERIVFRPLGLEVQKSIIEALAIAKLQVLQNYFQLPYRSTGGRCWRSCCGLGTTRRRVCECYVRRLIASSTAPAWTGR
jgi:hypothetical protein